MIIIRLFKITSNIKELGSPYLFLTSLRGKKNLGLIINKLIALEII